jgi:hypothetical protein
MFSRSLLTVLVASCLALSAIALGSGAAAGQSDAGASRVCPISTSAARFECLSEIYTTQTGQPLANSDNISGYGPAQFHAAYNLPTTAPIGQTIAIVDAYANPSVYDDLQIYDRHFGLPTFPLCSTDQQPACLAIFNQDGAASPLPVVDDGWSSEISLDVQVSHAICQNCRINLYEANSNSITDLGAAVNTAVAMGANVVSNSYGARGSECDVPAYNHPNVAIVVSSGDSGYDVACPASMNTVISVGGTSLFLNGNGGYGSESVWRGTGSGCLQRNTAQSWQTSASNWSSTGCGNFHGMNDVAADADPSTGAAIYDSYGYGGWVMIGGTSLSAPLIAGVYALAGSAASWSYPAQSIYQSPGSFHDVTSGSNGTCTYFLQCNAVSGYDLPTGIGTPNGLGGFGAAKPPDTTPPVGYWDAPADNATITSDTVPLQAHATDSGGSHLASMAFSANWSGAWHELTYSTGEATSDALSLRESYDLCALDVPDGDVALRLEVVDGAGNDFTTDRHITKSHICNTTPTLPVAPTNLTAVGLSASEISLNWADNAGNESEYRIKRAAYNGSGWDWPVVKTLAADTTSWTDVGLTADTDYDYYVCAYNSTGEVCNNADVTGHTLPPPSLAVNDVSLNENAGNATFTVNLSAASGQSVTFNYATADGTASAPADYAATSGSVAFNPGQTSKTISVPIIDDTINEPTEAFFVNLSGATNATIADSQGVGTIVDNDHPTGKPDGRIRMGTGAYVGNNVYNTTGLSQSLTGAAKKGKTVTFTISIQNDGSSKDSFRLLVTGPVSALYTVSYFHGTTNITAKVVAGTFTTPGVKKNKAYLITVKVKVLKTATVGSSVSRLVTITSIGDGSKQDAVGFVGKRK